MFYFYVFVLVGGDVDLIKFLIVLFMFLSIIFVDYVIVFDFLDGDCER